MLWVGMLRMWLCVCVCVCVFCVCVCVFVIVGTCGHVQYIHTVHAYVRMYVCIHMGEYLVRLLVYVCYIVPCIVLLLFVEVRLYVVIETYSKTCQCDMGVVMTTQGTK